MLFDRRKKKGRGRGGEGGIGSQSECGRLKSTPNEQTPRAKAIWSFCVAALGGWTTEKQATWFSQHCVSVSPLCAV